MIALVSVRMPAAIHRAQSLDEIRRPNSLDDRMSITSANADDEMIGDEIPTDEMGSGESKTLFVFEKIIIFGRKTIHLLNNIRSHFVIMTLFTLK